MFLSLLDLMRQSGARLGDPIATGAPAPLLQLTDTGDALRVTVQLTGYDPRSVQLQLSETALAVGAQSTREEKTEGPDFLRVQSSRSGFYRALPLPARVNPHQASTQWQPDGALVITLPKV